MPAPACSSSTRRARAFGGSHPASEYELGSGRDVLQTFSTYGGSGIQILSTASGGLGFSYSLSGNSSVYYHNSGRAAAAVAWDLAGTSLIPLQTIAPGAYSVSTPFAQNQHSTWLLEEVNSGKRYYEVVDVFFFMQSAAGSCSGVVTSHWLNR